MEEQQQEKRMSGEVGIRPTSNIALRAQSVDTATGTLSQRCYKYSTELGRLRHEALEGAEISAFAKSLLNPAASRLQDIRVRLDIWMSDVDFENGSLEETAKFRESRLHKVILDTFKRMQQNVEKIAANLAIIKDEARLMVSQRQVSRYDRGDVDSQMDG